MTVPAAPARAQGVLRRIIVLVVLYALVVIAAIGLSGLVERLLAGPAGVIADDAGSSLARSLAFALIAGPLAAVLWWWESRRLADADDPAERMSVAWGLYLLAMTLTALIAATLNLGAAVTAGLDGRWEPGGLAAGIVWAAVWVLHRMLRRSAAFAPATLGSATVALSALWGLGMGADGAAIAFARLVADAREGVGLLLVASQPSWIPVLQGTAWAAIGAVVWWWHWHRDGSKRASGGFAVVLLVVITAASAAIALFALGTLLHIALRLMFGAGRPVEVMASFDLSLGAMLVAGIVWAYHAGLVQQATSLVRRATRLALSGIGLIGAASGFGVVVNALLAAMTQPLADASPRTLLLGGLSALVVGAPVWWLAWRPAHAAAAAEDPADDRARRVHLVVVFGVSAIAAIIALLTIAYRLFAFWFDPAVTQGLIDFVRAPLGVLVATALVFGYHFAVWRGTRASAAASERLPIGRIVLVAGEGADAVARTVRAETGVAVEIWRPADTDAGPVLDGADVAALLDALRAVHGSRVLVVAEQTGPRVIPIAG